MTEICKNCGQEESLHKMKIVKSNIWICKKFEAQDVCCKNQDEEGYCREHYEKSKGCGQDYCIKEGCEVKLCLMHGGQKECGVDGLCPNCKPQVHEISHPKNCGTHSQQGKLNSEKDLYLFSYLADTFNLSKKREVMMIPEGMIPFEMFKKEDEGFGVYIHQDNFKEFIKRLKDHPACTFIMFNVIDKLAGEDLVK